MLLRDVLIGLVVLLVVALLQAVYFLITFLVERKKSNLKRRLQAVGEPDDAMGLGRANLLKRTRFGEASEGFFANLEVVRKLARLLDQTELTITVPQLLMACGILGGAGLALGLFFNLGLMTFVATVVLALAPILFVRSAASRRTAALTQQLPDALEMMTRALRAGHGLPQSFKLVAQELPPPIATEFGRVYEDQRLGMPFDQAVVAMTDRAPGNLELRIMAVSMVIQAQTGGNLIEVLEKIANTIRERFKFFGRLRALTAEGKMAALILGALPFVVFAAIYVLNRPYIVELVKDPKGPYVLGFGGLLWGTGLFWMSRIVKVEF